MGLARPCLQMKLHFTCCGEGLNEQYFSETDIISRPGFQSVVGQGVMVRICIQPTHKMLRKQPIRKQVTMLPLFVLHMLPMSCRTKLYFVTNSCALSPVLIPGEWGLSPRICDRTKLHFLPSWSFLTCTLSQREQIIHKTLSTKQLYLTQHVKTNDSFFTVTDIGLFFCFLSTKTSSPNKSKIFQKLSP